MLSPFFIFCAKVINSTSSGYLFMRNFDDSKDQMQRIKWTKPEEVSYHLKV